MKHSAIVFATRQAVIVFSARKSAMPRRLRITRWQTHSWTKKIISARVGGHRVGKGRMPFPCVVSCPFRKLQSSRGSHSSPMGGSVYVVQSTPGLARTL